jgi:hypothetical protein
MAKTGNEGCNEIVTTFCFLSLPPECPLPSGGVSRFLQFISMLIRVNRQSLPGRQTLALCVRHEDGTFIRANCATLGAIGNDADAFIGQVWQKTMRRLFVFGTK